MKKIVLFGFCLLWLSCMESFAQSRVTGQSQYGGSHPTKPGYRVLRGNVVLQYQGMVIYCDYAEQNPNTNEFYATGNLRIRMKDKSTITGKELTNYPRQDITVIDKDVVYTSKDKKTILYTDRLTQNNKTEVASYYTGGRIVSDSTVLTSLRGHFISEDDAFHCKTNVVVTNPEYTINTDTMQLINNVVYFFSPTHVYTTDNYMYCESGWYHTEDEIAFLKQNAFVVTDEQKLYGDSIFYNRLEDFGEAFDNVVLIDSIRDMIVHSDYALSQKKLGDAWFTKNAVATVITDRDSLFLHGDTLRIAYDTNNDVKHILAYYNVNFFREDMQGACDSMIYLMSDSTMRMYKDPVIWSNQDQLTGDSIVMFLANNKPQYMHLGNNAFVISKSYQDNHFNQIKGQFLIGYFNDSSQLENVHVDQQVETIYYVTDDLDSSLIGILKVNSEFMQMRLIDQRITSINYVKPDAGSMYPERDLSPSERILAGFDWKESIRPQSKLDIFQKHSETNKQASQPILEEKKRKDSSISKQKESSGSKRRSNEKLLNPNR